MAIQVNINRESWPLESEFRISRGSRKVSEVITVSISEEKFTGRGECFPYARYNETLDSVEKQIFRIIPELNEKPCRQYLRKVLPPGAARNAVAVSYTHLRAHET